MKTMNATTSPVVGQVRWASGCVSSEAWTQAPHPVFRLKCRAPQQIQAEQVAGISLSTASKPGELPDPPDSRERPAPTPRRRKSDMDGEEHPGGRRLVIRKGTHQDSDIDCEEGCL